MPADEMVDLLRRDVPISKEHDTSIHCARRVSNDDNSTEEDNNIPEADCPRENARDYFGEDSFIDEEDFPPNQEAFAAKQQAQVQSLEESGNSSFLITPMQDIPDDIDVPWSNIQQHLFNKSLAIMNVRGDGFCFLRALQYSMWGNHEMEFSLEELADKIMDHILENASRYRHFANSEERMIRECLEFFCNKEYNTDSVDIIVQAAAAALYINLDIYMNRLDSVYVLKIRPVGSGSRIVPLLFKDSHLHPMLNHYDAIVPLSWDKQFMADTDWKSTSRAARTSMRSWCKLFMPSVLGIFDDEADVSGEHTLGDHSRGKETCDPPLTQGQGDVLKHLQKGGDGQFVFKPPHPAPREPPDGYDSDDGSDGSDSDCQYLYDDMSNVTHESAVDPDADVTIIEEDFLRVEASRAERDGVSTSILPRALIDSHVFKGGKGGDDEQSFEKICNMTMEEMMRLVMAGAPQELNDLIVHPRIVGRIPEDINGTCVFIVPKCKGTWQADTSDRRHFWLSYTTRVDLRGKRKTGLCKGQLECVNKECYHFRSYNGERNRSNWLKGAAHHTCKYCHHLAKRSGCGARKVVEYHYIEEFAIVWHYGQHKCRLKRDIAGKKRQITQRLQEDPKSESISAQQYGIDQLTKHLRDKDMVAFKKDLNVFSDPAITRRALRDNVQPVNEDTTSWDAICTFKSFMDETDKYLVYKVNNKDSETGSRDFVFKSSRQAANVAVLMDQNKDVPDCPYESTAYIDAKHRRTAGFKTLAMWTYHSGLRATYRLAVMDVRGETKKDLKKFIELFNEILEEVTGQEGYKFNPRYFIVDHAGANFNALEDVYGEEFVSTRVMGCGWHFEKDAKKRARLLPAKDQHQFLSICHQLLRTHTSVDYVTLMDHLGAFVLQHPMLHCWAKWWVARQCYTFGPFRDPDAALSNLSEAGNASFNVRGTPKALIDVCRRDVATQLYMDENLKNLGAQETSVKEGRGPSHQQIVEKDRVAQNKRAREYGKELSNATLQVLERDVLTSSRPAFHMQSEARHRPPRSETFPVGGSWSSSTDDTARRAATSNVSSVGEREAEDIPRPGTGRGQKKSGRGRGRGTASVNNPSRGRGRGRGRGDAAKQGPGGRQGKGVRGRGRPPKTGTAAGSVQANRPAAAETMRCLPSFQTLSRNETLRIIGMAEQVLGHEVQELNRPRWKSQAATDANPPTLVLNSSLAQNIFKCWGCRNNINIKEAAPQDMLMRARVLYKWTNDAGRRCQREQPGTFHLDWKCIQKTFPAIDTVEVNCSFDTLSKLDKPRMEVLLGKGLLEPLIATKKYP